MAKKLSAVDRVIQNLESEKAEIDRTIARLRAAQAAAPKRARRGKDAVAPKADVEKGGA